MSIRKAIQEALQRRGIWWHTVNDNEKPGGGTGSIAKEGRLYLHAGKQCLRWS